MDVDVCVLHMLDRAVSQKKIVAMLEDLQDNQILAPNKFQELLRLVLARTGAVVDVGPVFPEPNQRLILSHAAALLAARDPVKAKEALDALELKLQCLWDFETRTYRP